MITKNRPLSQNVDLKQVMAKKRFLHSPFGRNVDLKRLWLKNDFSIMMTKNALLFEMLILSELGPKND